MKVLSLFAGIGGADLGLERAGMTIVGQVEIDPFCRAVLRKHWPSTWQHDDVKTLTGHMVEEHCGRIDLIVAGVPCQPISTAGRRAGNVDARWLWPDFARIVGEVRPRLALAESPVGLLSHPSADAIPGLMEAAGYEMGDPFVLGASIVGAPHQRRRIWMVAYPASWGGQAGAVVDPEAEGGRNQARTTPRLDVVRCREFQWPGRDGDRRSEHEVARTVESAVGTATDGVSERLARSWRRRAYRAVGNAISPQVIEPIGRAMMALYG